MNSVASRWIPWAFVLLWSTGFIGAKLGLPFIAPFRFLAIRMALTLLCFALLIALYRPAWPNWRQARQQWLSGILLHGLYLGGVFAAIKLAVPAGLTALIVGLQPLLTAILSWQLGEQHLQRRQWLGMLVGFVGTALVVAGSKGLVFAGNTGLWFAVMALLVITAGTLYQKRHGQGVHPLTGTFHQYLSAFLLTSLLSLWFEPQSQTHWNGQLLFAIGWSVLMLSVLAILLLMRMIREGDVSRVVSYFYLVPGLTALQAWCLFAEKLSAMTMAGIVVAALGVALVLKGGSRT